MDMDAEEDFRELARGALRGDEQRARFLFEIAEPRFRAIVWTATRRYRALGLLTSEAVEKDVTNMAEGQLWKQRTKYRGDTPGKLTNLLKLIARAQAQEFIDREGHSVSPDDSLASGIGPTDDDGILNQQERLDPRKKEAVRVCLERLAREEPVWHAVLVCKWLFGMSFAEIAGFLWGRKTRKGTASTYYKHALARLRTCLGQHGIEDFDDC
ncbi:MAG: hypothetical protein KKB50_09125 [Planctomycetes bacterium]|nr:hypothetical protein [Planctomycetota bacterium]